MAWGLPKLPGLTFSDPTKTQYHMRSSLRYYQGHRFPDTVVRGPGGTATDVDSNAFALPDDSVKWVQVLLRHFLVYFIYSYKDIPNMVFNFSNYFEYVKLSVLI